MTQRQRSRKNAVIALAIEAREVLPDPKDSELFLLIEECTGWYLSDSEQRLAVVAFDLGNAKHAKKSIWYA
jgi:hypothetical protein